MNDISNERDLDFAKEEIINNKILLISLNKPNKGNTLSLQTIKYLSNRLDQISNDKKIRVLIIASEGKIFSAGHDLKEIIKNDKLSNSELFRECSELMIKITKLPQPVIAQVDGFASAAGCQLVATCDLAIASKESFFSTPGIKIGLFCSTPMVALTRAVNTKKSLEMLLTGEAIDANYALEIGLINKVETKQNLKKEVLNLAQKLCDLPREVLAIGKKTFYNQIDLNLSEAYNYTSNVMVENLLMEESKEGIKAFIQKRPAKWNNN